MLSRVIVRLLLVMPDPARSSLQELSAQCVNYLEDASPASIKCLPGGRGSRWEAAVMCSSSIRFCG